MSGNEAYFSETPFVPPIWKPAEPCDQDSQFGRFLSDPDLCNAIFNSRVYNVSMVSFRETPLMGQAEFDVAVQRGVELAKSKLKPTPKTRPAPESDMEETKTADPASATDERHEAMYWQYRYLTKINQNHVVEILFVLSTLLSGKRKGELQRKFLTPEFLRRLIQLFNRINWKLLPISVLIPAVPCRYLCRTVPTRR